MVQVETCVVQVETCVVQVETCVVQVETCVVQVETTGRRLLAPLGRDVRGRAVAQLAARVWHKAR